MGSGQIVKLLNFWCNFFNVIFLPKNFRFLNFFFYVYIGCKFWKVVWRGGLEAQLIGYRSLVDPGKIYGEKNELEF